METPSRHSFDLDGATRVFPIPSPIKGDNYCRLEVDGVIINDRSKYDIVNNSIVFIDAADVPDGSQLDVLVVQSEEAIGQLTITTNIDIVATNIADINTVADDITNVDTTATNITNVNTVATNITNVNTTATNITNVNTVASNIADVTSVADNMAEVLTADTNAATATTQAGIATTQATNAATSASNASDAQSYAEEWANKAEDSLISIAAGGDGSTEYSAKHWAAKAEDEKIAAAASAAAAASDAAGVAALYDAFDDRYLGSKASDPALDNDGNALTDGALYFDTTSNVLKVYDLGNTTWLTIPQLTLASMTDVTLTSIASGEILKWNGSAWINNTLAEAGIVGTSDIANMLETTDIGVTVQGYDADTAKLDVAQSWTAAQRGATETATLSTDKAIDFSSYQNFVYTLNSNITLTNPSTETVGQSGFIVFIQDGTGGRTVSLGTDYETAGGAGLTLSSTASTTDVVPYIVAASGRVLLGAPQLAFA